MLMRRYSDKAQDTIEDTDPEDEAPGPAAPRSPIRGLPEVQQQPPSFQHPSLGTPPEAQEMIPHPATPPEDQEEPPLADLRSGNNRLTYQQGLATLKRIKAEKQGKSKKK